MRETKQSPVGENTPAFVGEVVYDMTNDHEWIATGITNEDWEVHVTHTELA